jgi:hypothetical protein
MKKELLRSSTTNQNLVDISTLATGMYFVSVETAEETFTMKFVKGR